MAGTAALAAYVLLRGLAVPWPAAALLVTLLGAVGAVWLTRRLPGSLDGARLRRPWLAAAWLLFSLAALGQTARLSSFMLDPARSRNSLFPGEPWYVAHCCLTAYTESERMAQEGAPNIYDPARYFDRSVGSFSVDVYHYPPPFLLLPLAARAAAGGDGAGGVDFLAARKIWFGASALAFLLAFGLVASRLEREAQLRALAAAPAMWCSIPLLLGLQFSNFQILAVALSVLALVAFPRRAALGGAILALGIVSKIFPGILLVYLVARRRWREAGWTGGFAILFVGLAFAAVLTFFGIMIWYYLSVKHRYLPFIVRIFEERPLFIIPRGEPVEDPFSRTFAVAFNMAPFGVPLKLAQLGVPGMTLKTGHAVSLLYGLFVVALVFWSARRAPRSRLEEASVWLALLSLGTLASPFAPAAYVLASTVFLICIDRDDVRPAALVVMWIVISAPFLLPREGPFLPRFIAYLPAQILALAVPAFVLWRAGKPGPIPVEPAVPG